MKYLELNLDVKFAETKPKLTAYLPDNTTEVDINLKRKTIVICPGGGYSFTSDREGEPVALKLASCGYNAFVLKYTCDQKKFPTQLCELATAVSLIRKNACEWNVDTDNIVLAGFSAGGHLIGSLGTLWHEDFLEEITGLKKEQYKPNALMFAYSVISTDYPQRSFENLLNDKKDYFDKVSIEKNVTKNMPTSFIWHTDNDPVVNSANSLLLATAMKIHDIPLELHIFPNGAHGLALCNEVTAKNETHIETNVEIWFDLFIKWLKSY